MTACGACLFHLGKHSSQITSRLQTRFLYLPPNSAFQSMISQWLICKVRELSCSAETKAQALWPVPCNHQTPRSSPRVCGMGTCMRFCQDHQGLGRKPDRIAKSGQHSSDKGKRPWRPLRTCLFYLKSFLSRAEAGGGVEGWRCFCLFH